MISHLSSDRFQVDCCVSLFGGGANFVFRVIFTGLMSHLAQVTTWLRLALTKAEILLKNASSKA
jgi:hypothetical protein